MTRHILDISRPISERLPVWPGDPPTRIELHAGADGSIPVVRQLSFGSHTGTHVDPPAHFVPGGRTVDQLPLDVLIGPAWLVHLPGEQPISATMLRAAGVPAGVTRLLIRTRNSDAPLGEPRFDERYVALDATAAQWVLERGMRLVGIDAPSIAAWDDIDTVHVMLLEAEIVALEGLYLAGVAPGDYELVCLPLPILGGDGAPARVVLINND